MLSWFTTRVFMFPVFVIYSTLFEALVRHTVGRKQHACSTLACAPNSCATNAPSHKLQARAKELGVSASIQPHHAILNAFLIFLYCLHIYW